MLNCSFPIKPFSPKMLNHSPLAKTTDETKSFVVGAAYHHEPQQVITLLEQVACQHPRVLQHPAPQAFAIDFAESSINYKLKYSVRNPLEARTVSSDLRQEIWTAFNDHGIGIPFPQRQVYPMEWPPNRQSSLQSQHTPHEHSTADQQDLG